MKIYDPKLVTQAQWDEVLNKETVDIDYDTWAKWQAVVKAALLRHGTFMDIERETGDFYMNDDWYGGNSACVNVWEDNSLTRPVLHDLWALLSAEPLKMLILVESNRPLKSGNEDYSLLLAKESVFVTLRRTGSQGMAKAFRQSRVMKRLFNTE